MCEFCGNDKDIIFPFQLNKCQRCEGEPSLPVAGLGGSRAPSPRPFFPLTWRDWKISNPRRLAKALSKDRREGEGGEEDLEKTVNEEVICGEEKVDTAEERQGRGTKSEREETKCDKEEEDDGGREVHCKERARSKERGKEKVNLLKVFHIDRLKKRISKGDRSDSETWSSVESLDEVGQERKGRWKVSGLANLAKGFSRRDSEDEGKEKEERFMDIVDERGTEDEGESRKEDEQNDDISEKGQMAETEKPGAGEKYALKKLLKPHRMSGLFSKGRSRAEWDRSGESDEKRGIDTEEEEPAVITRTTWRGRKTRKALRVTKGRKNREGTEMESKTESGGESAEVDECSEESGGQE